MEIVVAAESKIKSLVRAIRGFMIPALDPDSDQLKVES